MYMYQLSAALNLGILEMRSDFREFILCVCVFVLSFVFKILYSKLECKCVFLDENRFLAADFKGSLGLQPDVPEWKKHAFGGNKVSYGKKTKLSLLEQRQALPIYKLRTELVQVQWYADQRLQY